MKANINESILTFMEDHFDFVKMAEENGFFLED